MDNNQMTREQIKGNREGHGKDYDRSNKEGLGDEWGPKKEIKSLGYYQDDQIKEVETGRPPSKEAWQQVGMQNNQLDSKKLVHTRALLCTDSAG